MESDDGRRTIDRDQLYKLVWSKPMIHAAAEFGISGNGLAKVCSKLDGASSSSRLLGQARSR